MAAIIYNPSVEEYSFTQSGVVAGGALLFDIDAAQLPPNIDFVLHVSSLGTSGVITCYSGNYDAGVGRVAVPVESVAAGSGQSGTINAAGMYLIPTVGRYVQVVMSTGATGGTTTLKLFPVGTSQRKSVTVGGSLPAIVGQTAHDSAVTGNPVRVGARALSALLATVATGDVHDLVSTLNGALINKPYSIPEADWQYAAAAGGIVNTTDVVLKAAGAAGIRNYLTRLDVRNGSATATEFVIKDGSTVIWRQALPASMSVPVSIEFPTPLRGTAATALNAACITTGAAVFVNAGGYSAA